jgi:hypothetical protein
MIINIPDDWLPTSENINALPKPVRDFIMRLHANTDPAGELQRAMVAERERDALRKMIEEAPGGLLVACDFETYERPTWHVIDDRDAVPLNGGGKRVKLVVIDG